MPENDELEGAGVLALGGVKEEVATALDDTGVDGETDAVGRLEAELHVDRTEPTLGVAQPHVRPHAEVLDHCGQGTEQRPPGDPCVELQPVPAAQAERQRVDLADAEVEVERDGDLEATRAFDVETGLRRPHHGAGDLEAHRGRSEDPAEEAVRLRRLQHDRQRRPRLTWAGGQPDDQLRVGDLAAQREGGFEPTDLEARPGRAAQHDPRRGRPGADAHLGVERRRARIGEAGDAGRAQLDTEHAVEVEASADAHGEAGRRARSAAGGEAARRQWGDGEADRWLGRLPGRGDRGEGDPELCRQRAVGAGLRDQRDRQRPRRSEGGVVRVVPALPEAIGQRGFSRRQPQRAHRAADDVVQHPVVERRPGPPSPGLADDHVRLADHAWQAVPMDRATEMREPPGTCRGDPGDLGQPTQAQQGEDDRPLRLDVTQQEVVGHRRREILPERGLVKRRRHPAGRRVVGERFDPVDERDDRLAERVDQRQVRDGGGGLELLGECQRGVEQRPDPEGGADRAHRTGRHRDIPTEAFEELGEGVLVGQRAVDRLQRAAHTGEDVGELGHVTARRSPQRPAGRYRTCSRATRR